MLEALILQSKKISSISQTDIAEETRYRRRDFKKTENNLQEQLQVENTSSDFMWTMFINMRWLKTCGRERDFSRKMRKVKMPLSFKEGRIDNYYLPVIYRRFKGVGKFMPYHKTPLLMS